MRGLRKLLLVPALALPLTAGTCTEEKLIDLVIGLPTTAEFNASGELNEHSDTDDVDIKEDLDIPGALEDADLDASSIESIQVVQIFYRITRPEAGRSITGGYLEFTRVNVSGPHTLVSGLTVDVSAATDWIDVTSQLQTGINQINTFLNDYLTELQGGPAVANSLFRYHVQGNSVPADVETDFDWEVKIVIQAVAAQEFEIPFG